MHIIATVSTIASETTLVMWCFRTWKEVKEKGISNSLWRVELFIIKHAAVSNGSGVYTYVVLRSSVHPFVRTFSHLPIWNQLLEFSEFSRNSLLMHCIVHLLFLLTRRIFGVSIVYIIAISIIWELWYSRPQLLCNK